jgi:peptidoglycan/LPS O-acetylase OafA/YrhL
MQRYAFIDAIRGIAALSVMLQHSLYQSGLLGDFAHHATLTGFIPTRLELGETGVVAFFLSGAQEIRPTLAGAMRYPAPQRRAARANR